MRMRRLALLAAGHLAMTTLLVLTAPRLFTELRTGDPGAGLLLIAGSLCALTGARLTASVLLALLHRGLLACGLALEPLRDAALAIAPHAARGALTVALSGSLGAAAFAGPALAQSPSPAWPLVPTAAAPDPSWPLTGEHPSPPDTSPPDFSPPDLAQRDLSQPGGEPADIHLVAPGDSLWSIAAEHLPGAGAPQVADAVAALQDTNRDVVGPDANLILPGQRLVLP